MSNLHESLDIFFANRCSMAGDITFLHPSRSVQDNVAIRIFVKAQKILTAYAIEIDYALRRARALQLSEDFTPYRPNFYPLLSAGWLLVWLVVITTTLVLSTWR